MSTTENMNPTETMDSTETTNTTETMNSTKTTNLAETMDSTENMDSTGIIDPYEKCPTFRGNRFLVRLIDPEDVYDLFRVYSDEKAVPFFNSDNCDGDDFHYTSLERMQNAVDFWIQAYQEKWFIRFTIIDMMAHQTIGTIELFNRQAQDYFNDCGLLRLDLKSSYERADVIKDILSMVVPPAYYIFHCRMIATKIPPFASERKAAAEAVGFTESTEALVGNDGKRYLNYYVAK